MRSYLRVSRLATLLACSIATSLLLTAVASAGQITVFTCHDPAGNPVGHDGWTISRTPDQFMTAADNCAGSGQGALLLDMGANSAGYPNYAGIDWVFAAPGWAKVARYTIQIADSYTYPYQGAGEGQAAVQASDETDPTYDFRNLGGGSEGHYTIQRTPPAPVSSIAMNTSCDGQFGSCPAGAQIAHMDISSAQIVLSDSTTPAVVSGLSGGLVASAPARGVAEASFDATDSGPGVYSGQLVVDGEAQPAVVLNSNNGWCKDMGQTTDGTRSFAHPEPCPQSTSGTVSLDTTRFADGAHTLKLLVDDASGNATTAFNGTLTTDNAPSDSSPPAIITPSQVFTGTVLSGQPGSWSAPSGAGTVTYGYQWEDCDTQGTNCQAIPGAQSPAYTVAPSDVGHTLRVAITATDKDGAASAPSSPTSTVLAEQSSLGALPGPGTSIPSTVSGASTTALEVGQGSANGTLATETAILRLGVPYGITRPFAHRAVTIAGRLLNAVGSPVEGAWLDVLQQIAGTSAMHTIGRVRTRFDGTFTARVTAGPSRLIEIGYRAFSGDHAYAAQASIHESVSAGVQLRITPRYTSTTGTIYLSGIVYGPLPTHGVIVDLLVHYRHHWVPFRTPRTNRHGRFRVPYQFQGSHGHFPFRAEVISGQANFPYSNGYSPIISVSTR